MAEFNSALSFAWAAYKADDFVRARALFAEAGNEGLFNLGQMTRNGEGGEVDSDKARELFEQCGDDAYSLCALGEMWQSGELGETEIGDHFLKARHYFAKSVALGDAAAMCMLAAMHHGGQGGEVNHAEARCLFELAAKEGDSEARSLLAKMCLAGEGGPVDLVEARRLYQIVAIEEEDAEAQRNFGIMCYRGEGGPKDLTAAHQYIQLAASQGDEFAKSKLPLVEGHLIQDALQQSGLKSNED